MGGTYYGCFAQCITESLEGESNITLFNPKPVSDKPDFSILIACSKDWHRQGQEALDSEVQA
jgi:hypothetical protein